MNSDEAKQILEDGKREREEKVKDKFQKLLDEENCTVEISVLLTSSGNAFQLNIKAKD